MADITSRLVARWSCDDASDGQLDESVAGYHLTVTSGSGATAGYPQRVNQQGNSRRFSRATTTSGSNAVPDNFASRAIAAATLDAIAGSGNGNGGQFTVAAWLRYRPNQGSESTGIGSILALRGDGLTAASAQQRAFALLLRQIRSVSSGPDQYKYSLFWTIPPNTGTSLIASFIPPADEWAHIAFVVRTNVAGVSYFIDYYVNGVLLETSASLSASFAQGGLLPAGATVQVSNLAQASDFTPQSGQWAGYVRDLRIYTRVLTAEDLALLVATTLPTSRTVTSVTRAGVDVAGAAVAPGGDEFPTYGQEYALVKNAGGSTVTVSFTVQRQLDGLTVAARTVDVAAGQSMLVGPWPASLYGDGRGVVQLQYSDPTSMSIKVLKLAPG